MAIWSDTLSIREFNDMVNGCRYYAEHYAGIASPADIRLSKKAVEDVLAFAYVKDGGVRDGYVTGNVHIKIKDYLYKWLIRGEMWADKVSGTDVYVDYSGMLAERHEAYRCKNTGK